MATGETAVRLHWSLAAHSDGVREVVDVDNLKSVARAAENFGFEAVVVPAGDAWALAAVAAREVDRITFVVTVRPGLASPIGIAQESARFHRKFAGRIMVRIAADDGDAADWLLPADRDRRNAEFLTVLRRAWSGGSFHFVGTYYQASGPDAAARMSAEPPVLVDGASRGAGHIAAQFANTFTAWAEPPRMFATRISGIRSAAIGYGRAPSVGVRLRIGDPEFAARSATGGGPGPVDGFESLWSRAALVRRTDGVTLVGSCGQIADRIADYCAIGVDQVIIEGAADVDGIRRFGEGVVPLLRARGLLEPVPALAPTEPPLVREFADVGT